MTSRREENEISRDTRPSYRGGGLGFPSINQHVGPTRRQIEFSKIESYAAGDSYIDSVWAEVDGLRVTEIEIGNEFHILVTFYAENALTGMLDRFWSCCVTAVDTSGQLRAWNAFATPILGSNHISRGGGGAKLNKPINGVATQLVMPDQDVSFRLQLWGNDAYPEPSTPPALELW
ncbi:hypothetical protein KKE60_04630 [Patescibacteria group bacterium]|nr:hypothetical protein [Patescibacteria group bacterium]